MKTAATTEPDVRRVVDRLRRTALRDEAMFEIRLYPSTIAKITPIRQTLNGTAGAGWQAELLADYSFNRNSNLDQITMRVASLQELPIDGVKATELLRNRMTTIQISAVVRVDRLTPETALAVGKYYENVAKDVQWLHVYLTDSNEKWSEFPNVYPATVPPQIGLVYDRGPRREGRVIKGSEFK